MYVYEGIENEKIIRRKKILDAIFSFMAILTSTVIMNFIHTTMFWRQTQFI